MSLTAKLAAHFKANVGRWIDGRELATVAGAYAWRTRVSELRKAPWLMTIENREMRGRRLTASNEWRNVVTSEYRYVPEEQP